MPSVFLANYFPIEELRVKITVDKKVDLNFQKFNIDVIDWEIKEKKNEKIYELVLRNVEPIHLEGGGPSFYALCPHLAFSVNHILVDDKKEKVMGNLDDMYETYCGFLNSVDTTIASPFVALVDSITQNKTTELEKVASVYDWVKQQVKYIAFEDNMGGFIPRNPQDIFDKRFGDCKDMTSLIVKMLNTKNIKAHHSWVGTRRLPYKYSESCGSFIDNHMIAMYHDPLEDKFYYLDATNEYLPFGLAPAHLQEKEVLIHQGKEKYKIYTTPVTDCSLSKNQETCSLKIEGQNLIGKYAASFTGYEYSNYQRIFARMSEKSLIKRYQTYFAKGSNKSRLTNIKTDSDNKIVNTSFDITIEDYISRTEDEIFVNMNLDKVLENIKIPAHRKLDIDMSAGFNYLKEYIIEIPEGYKVGYIPDDFNHQADEYSINISYEQKNNQIIYHYDLCSNKIWIKNDEFDTWSKFIKLLKKNYKENVILAKI